MLLLFLGTGLSGWVGCDVIEPIDDSLLIVEGFLNTDGPVPEVTLRRSMAPNGDYSEARAAVTTAEIELTVAGELVRYTSSEERPGTYVPERSDVSTAAGSPYIFRVRWEESDIEVRGTLPPPIEIQDVHVEVPDAPVEAVLLDSLALEDSMATGAYTGYIYPIEVTVSWEEPSSGPRGSWVRTQLKPYTPFSSTVVDLFLKSDDVLHEADQASDGTGTRRWSGVYAVGVPNSEASLPEHQLRVALIRSDEVYARFAASRDNPSRREPISNVSGAAGIFTAVAVDSLQLSVHAQSR